MSAAAQVDLGIISALLEGSVMRMQDPRIEKRGGMYRMRVYVPRVTESGQIVRKREHIALGTTATEAKLKKAQILSTLNSGGLVLQAQIPLSVLIQKFRDARLPQLASSTRVKYETHLPRIEAAFGAMKLADIDMPLIEAWCSGLPLAHATRLDVRNLISALFTAATRWKLWSGPNPAHGAGVGRGGPVREKRSIDSEGLQRFLAAIPDTATMAAEKARLLALTALVGGLRVSECLGLRDVDLDPAKRTATVNQRYCRGDFDQPKTARARRRVALGPLFDELAKLGSGLLFARSDGSLPDDRELQQHVWVPAARAAGIYHLGFGLHSLRRLRITWAQEEGATPVEAMRQAGHGSLSTTLLYTLDDEKRQAALAEKIAGRVMDTKGRVM